MNIDKYIIKTQVWDTVVYFLSRQAKSHSKRLQDHTIRIRLLLF